MLEAAHKLAAEEEGVAGSITSEDGGRYSTAEQLQVGDTAGQLRLL